MPGHLIREAARVSDAFTPDGLKPGGTLVKRQNSQGSIYSLPISHACNCDQAGRPVALSLIGLDMSTPCHSTPESTIKAQPLTEQTLTPCLRKLNTFKDFCKYELKLVEILGA